MSERTDTVSATSPDTSRRPSWRDREHPALAAWLFLLPSFAGFAIFTAVPVVAAAVISFLDWNLFSPPSWAGLNNFIELGSDPTFWAALGNTAVFTFTSVPLTILVSFVLALMVNQGFKRIAVVRSLLLLPYATITVAVAFVWIWLYIPTGGLINRVIGLFGIDGPAWLVSDVWAMPALVLMSVWKSFGFGMVIFLAGLQGISAELYEAASLDGASAWQKFRYITLPALRPTFNYVVIFGLIGSFQVFDQVFILTSGGPARSTETIVYRIYTEAFGNGKLGYASALSYVLLIMTLIVGLIQLYTNNKHEKEEIA